MKTVAVFGIIFVSIGVIVFLFVTGMLNFDQKNLDEPFQKIPNNFQDLGNTANEFAVKTSTILRETINEHLELVQVDPIDSTIENISEFPKTFSENNLLGQKPKIDKSELEITIHQLTNQYRLQAGLNLLSLDDKLSKIARSHSQDMASRDYFSHDSPEGRDPTDRGTSQGYKCEKIVGHIMYIGIAENIFQNNLYHTIWYTNGVPTSYDWNSLDDIAQTTVDGWMNSTGHRKNILTETFDREGIGVEIASNDKVYITQNFC
ncbi:MAG: CAP domain-containing protein [Nitrosopumilus sp.]|nr:CAP domain-containing protein [Nitrosopumilus sp.]